MRDFNILNYVGNSLWAITDAKMGEMIPALIRHAKGTKLTEDELQAFMGGRGENTPPSSSKRGAVAIIPVRGVVAHRMEALGASSGGASCEAIGRLVDQVGGDESIGAILYDFDTPGGTYAGLPELAAKMFALRGIKKQIAMITGQCCSAGYFLASQCDEIIASPSSEVGDIGVFFVHKDLSEALAKEGIKITLVKEGKHKAELSPFFPLSEEALENLKTRAAEAYGEFVKVVARGRGVTPAAVKAGYGEGRSLSVKDAKAAGLIDKIGTMEDTLSKLTGARPRAGGVRAEGETVDLSASLEDPRENLTGGADQGAATKDALAEMVASAEIMDPADEMRQRLERF